MRWITIILAAAALAGAAQVTAVARAVQDRSAREAPAPVEIRRPDLVADYHAADPAMAGPGAVIVLGGSEGGLATASQLARRLAEAGVSALAVAYFGEPGLPARLDQVPIEPVGRAREWLEAHPGHTGPVAVMGVSKGAELALVAASRDPSIRAVVAGVPSSVVWQGIDMSGAPTGSSWTLGGEPMAYTPYDLSQGFRSVHQLYVDSLAGAPPEAVIPVERINGPILLISGDADALWPSADMAGRIAARLSEHGFAHSVENLVYAGAGHAAFGPPLADTSRLERSLAFLGGSVEATTAARADGWPRVIAFLRAALAQP